MLSFFKGQVRSPVAFSTIGWLISEEIVTKEAGYLHKGGSDHEGRAISNKRKLLQFKPFPILLGCINDENLVHQ